MKLHRTTPFSSGHQFLEAPRWHDGRLWASDFFAGHVLRIEADGSHQPVAEIEGAPSGLGFLADGSILVVSQATATVRRIAPDGAVTAYADFSHIATGLGNDMLVSPSGHAYVGNFGFALGSEDPRTTNLAHVDPEGKVHRVFGDVLFPNGAALTADGRTLLLAETFAHRISAFDITDDGSPANLRTWAQLPDTVHPDGIALDTDGGVWFGNALDPGPASGFYRVLEGGEITDHIPTPGTWSIACAFGGAELDVLHLMCNTTTLEEFHEGRSAGEVRTASVGRRGVDPARTG
ncbi:SMP-30/gluconolactonase/LRE family protein [Pseudonocardia kongjuensis]|uniref:SMP-30/gluconolactonase/LRE family protein n=1 Tax=Pseudonocardia kongjuensis TaxID=102227 RepID=A0ABN1XIM4_9PSEU